MKYLSLFSGIGGFELGIDKAWECKRQEWPRSLQYILRDGDMANISEQPWDRPICIGYSEIDKYAVATYEKNFGKETRNYGDATRINTAELPDFDLLVGGFPCQAFSVAGKRAGFEDTRGTLIFDVVRVLRDKRPRYFVLENVKGLLSHDSGKTFSHILEILTDAGYDVSWSVHNSKNYGVPQNRERIYLIGHSRGAARPQVFPITTTDREVADINQVNQPTHSNDRVYSDKGISPTLNTMQGGNRQPFVMGKIDRAKQEFELKDTETAGALTATMWKGINATGRTGVKEPPRIRRLTPTECERLQGFPDNWTIGSDTQRYKQCGNAVTVNVVQSVIEQLMEGIK